MLTTCMGCTRQRTGQDSNSRPIDRKSSVLTTRPPSHTVAGLLVCPKHWGNEDCWDRLLTEGPKIEDKGRQRGGVLGEGAASKPPAHQLEGMENAVRSPAGFGAEPRPPKGFQLLSAPRMATPDSLIYCSLWISQNEKTQRDRTGSWLITIPSSIRK